MLRRGLVSLPRRAGGHAHPDFPFVGFYKHKRHISIYESPLWLTDGIQPEFIVDFEAPYATLGYALRINFLFAFAIPIIGSMILARIGRKFHKTPYIRRYAADGDQNIRKWFRRVREEKLANPKHPLGHNFTYALEGFDSNIETWYHRYLRI